MTGHRIFARCALSAVLAIAATDGARAEAGILRVSKGVGIHYLALYVMEKLQLVEKLAAAAGLGDEIGTLKTLVRSWKDVFFPIIHDEAGN